MVRIIIIMIFLSVTLCMKAQMVDTLSNLPEGTTLYAPKYTNPGQYGYVLGHNSYQRQQYAEKYYVEGNRTIKGLITYLTGVYEHPDNYIEFNVYQVSENGLPGNRLGGKQIFYKNLDLSGDAFTVTFNTPIAVQDSFFVTFNVFDYVHGGYEGDTLGLMAGQPGSRATEDLANFGRNAIQAHNHSKEDWKDFYSQNFTPIATHFALFPIVESIEVNGLAITESIEQIKVFPNPASDRLYIPFSREYEQISVFNRVGELVYQSNSYENGIDVSNWTSGMYLIKAQTGTNKTFSGKVIIH